MTCKILYFKTYGENRAELDAIEKEIDRWLYSGWEIKTVNYDSPNMHVFLVKKHSPFLE